MITKKQIIGLLKWYDDNRDYLNEIGADFDKTAEKVINEPELVKLFAIPDVRGMLLAIIDTMTEDELVYFFDKHKQLNAIELGRCPNCGKLYPEECNSFCNCP